MSNNVMYRKGMQPYPDYVDVTRLGRASDIMIHNYSFTWADDEDSIIDTKEYTIEVQRLESSKEYRYFRVYVLGNDFSRHVLCDFTIKMDDVTEMHIKMTDDGYAVSITDVLQDLYTATLHSTVIMYLARCTYEWATYLYYNYLETQSMVRDELLNMAKQEIKHTIH